MSFQHMRWYLVFRANRFQPIDFIHGLSEVVIAFDINFALISRLNSGEVPAEGHDDTAVEVAGQVGEKSEIGMSGMNLFREVHEAGHEDEWCGIGGVDDLDAQTTHTDFGATECSESGKSGIE